MAQLLALIVKLYAVEREAKDASFDERLTLRQERSVPLLMQIEAWLNQEDDMALPRSPMAGAISNRVGGMSVGQHLHRFFLELLGERTAGRLRWLLLLTRHQGNAEGGPILRNSPVRGIRTTST
ncbi:Transposase IS66 family protein [Pirellulimonas nuda]|uniref:Transposase IS66 family protein n=1 Tax=Pirellulimonas nuda TaxID=2528009 RepID=A0A518DC45_9BACT|nr:transposase [Pirellulimonas nuda]QDU89054.1 Transposase IS66 family protein [Pirellulimonas nuda]